MNLTCTNLCLVQVTDETFQLRASVTKKHHERNKIRRFNNQFVTRPTACGRCGKEGHNQCSCNVGIDEKLMDPAGVDEELIHPA